MSFFGNIHNKIVFSRRVKTLSKKIATLLPQNASVLDIGCGDGSIALMVQTLRPDITVRGIDVLVRPNAKIQVSEYDGLTFPFKDNTFDVVLFIDVLHHTDDPLTLLAEAMRVSSKYIVLKDHLRNGFMAESTLRFMDWFGNAHHGVRLPYNYWSEKEWQSSLHKLNLRATHWQNSLSLYPPPASWLFDRGLHFISRLESPQ